MLDLPAIAPIRPLLEDPDVTEIMINGPKQVYVERKGTMELSPLHFRDENALRFLVETIVGPTGRSVNESTPYVDFRLEDGSRVNVILPPVALGGATVTIRKFTATLKGIADLVGVGTLTARMADFLVGAIKARLNILFAGATGTGKTTTLSILSSAIAEGERIITIEDTAELELLQSHVVTLQCRQPNMEGEGEITLGDLFKNCLRMRPSRILVGEIRGEEALDMIQAMTSGHDGCLGVLHAGTPQDAISRLEMMAMSRGLMLPLWAIHKQLATGLDLILQHELLPDGSRKITHITDVCGVEGDHVQLQDIFRFEHGGRDGSGRQLGGWTCSGVEPSFMHKFHKHGIELPAGTLESGRA